MKLSSKQPALTLLVAFLLPSALSFTVPSIAMRPTTSRSRYGAVKAHVEHEPASTAPDQVGFAPDVVGAANRLQAARPSGSFERALQRAALGGATGFASASGALAEYVDPDDVSEVVSSELPPMWVPLAVGFVLVVGISLLQGSLGDVMNDEAKLGALSGARAAKQSARDRDMFKKKGPQ